MHSSDITDSSSWFLDFTGEVNHPTLAGEG